MSAPGGKPFNPFPGSPFTLDAVAAFFERKGPEPWPVEVSRSLDREGRTLASWLVFQGARWGKSNPPSRLLLRFCELGGDSAVPDGRGSVPVVDAWGDVDARITPGVVDTLSRAGVDWAAVRLDTGWSVLSDVCRSDRPTSAALDAIRGHTEQALVRLEPRERGLRLKRMAVNVHEEHRPWFEALQAAMTMTTAFPAARQRAARTRL